MAPTGLIGWYADRADPALASVRLRMLVPLQVLHAQGWAVEEYNPARGIAAYHTLVFSKSLTRTGLAIATEARRLGRRVIYDLCDNLHAAAPGMRRQQRVAVLEQFVQLADSVVFATSALRRQLLERHPELTARGVVIADALEDLEPSHAPLQWTDRWRLDGLRRFLARHPRALHCVWFGKSQGKLAGMPHLAQAVRELESFSRSHPVTLTVISNRWTRYLAHSLQWRVPHHYLPWSLATFGKALREHQVAVVPVEINAYTQGKSINRPATAILAGLGVVGDCIESYEELSQWVELAGWQSGLLRYAEQPPARDRRLAVARAYLADQYGAASIARQWESLFTALGGARTAAA